MTVTQISYDANLRPQCAAVRMNPSAFNSLPSSACSLGTTGSYGADRVTYTQYDAAGQVIEVDQAYGVSGVQRAYARYSYNPNGTKATEKDANGNLTTYIYDGFDRLSQIQYPSTTSGSGSANTADYEQFQYDANSNKTVWRRRNGKTLYYNYDNLNRETLRYVSDSSVQNVYSGYDLQGHVLYARYGSTSGAGITNAYDSLGRLTSATDMNGRAISYQYDSASNRTKLTYPDGNWQPYTYDAANRVTASGLGSGNYYISYDNLGRVTSVARGTNAAAGAVNYGYDAVGRLTSEAQDLAGTNYDVTWNWAFNPANQIMSMTASSTAYDYQETANGTVNNTYDGLNRDAGIAALNGGYDANGNLTYDGARTFTYDVYNHLLTATGNGANLNLVYDPLGRLAKYSTDGGSTFTTFLYDGTNLISEYDTSGNVSQRYVFGPGTDQPIIWFQGSQNTNPLYFVQDYHGSVIGYADASGNLEDVYKYGPYGEPKNAGNWTSFAGARFRYTGQTVIPEAQLYYYKARVYDPIFGRFLQTDPIGTKDDLDLYAYVGDDPIDKVDPTGLTCQYTLSGYKCQIDEVNTNSGHLTREQAKEVKDFNKSYTAAVNKLMANPNKTVSITVGGKTFNAKAGDVGNGLIGRNVTAELRPQYNSPGEGGGTAADGRTYIFESGIKGEVGPASEHGDVDRQITITHEGIHRSNGETSVFPDARDPATNEPAHSPVYDDAARQMLGVPKPEPEPEPQS